MTFYAHWRDVPKDAWRWPNFSPAEIACRGTGIAPHQPGRPPDPAALRTRLVKPLVIRSAYRSPEHNRAVGGANASKHMEGITFDVAMSNHDPEAFEAAARAIGFKGFGFYPRSGFIHIDPGPARNWGERFPKRATAFETAMPPASPRSGPPASGDPAGAGRNARAGAAADALPGYPPVVLHRRRARRYCRLGLRAAGQLGARPAAIAGPFVRLVVCHRARLRCAAAWALRPFIDPAHRREVRLAADSPFARQKINFPQA